MAKSSTPVPAHDIHPLTRRGADSVAARASQVKTLGDCRKISYQLTDPINWMLIAPSQRKRCRVALAQSHGGAGRPQAGARSTGLVDVPVWLPPSSRPTGSVPAAASERKARGL